MAAATADEVAQLRADLQRTIKGAEALHETVRLMNVTVKDQEREIAVLKALSGEETKKKEEEEKKAKGKDRTERRDLLIDKKGFGTLPFFARKIDKYEDWNFTVRTYLETEVGFDKLLKWVESLGSEPTEEDIEEHESVWEDRVLGGTIEHLNNQLYTFLCLNLKDEALTMAKNMKPRKFNAIQLWWKFYSECQSVSGQRTQQLAGLIFKPTRVKKYSDVMAALEKWELNVQKFQSGSTTTKLGPEMKMYSLKQLVPEELEMMIIAQSNNLKDYESVKKYILEQVHLRRDTKISSPVPMEVDALTDQIMAVAAACNGGAEDWHCSQAPEASGSYQEPDHHGERCLDKCEVNTVTLQNESGPKDFQNHQLACKLEEIMSFVKGKGKGKGGKGKGADRECWHCGKTGHIASECWQKDAEMQSYRANKGKGKGKDSYSSYNKGGWQNPKGKGKGGGG